MAQLEVWLIVVTVIVAVLLLFMSFLMLVYYSHPDDRNSAYVPKIIVVLSMTIAEVSVLMTALDVSNRAGAPGCGLPETVTYNITYNVTTDPNGTEIITNETTITQTPLVICYGGLDTALMWTILWFLIAIFVAFLIPFNIFFYEANEAGRKTSSRICEALQYQGVALVIAGLTLGLMYWQINMYTYPVLSVPNDPTDPTTQPLTCTGGAIASGCFKDQPYFDPNATLVIGSDNIPEYSEFKLSINNVPNTFGVYLGCFMAFVGWWLFCIYTGVGLITLPIDLIRGFRNRPKYIPKDVYIKLREDIRQRLDELIKLGTTMKDERKRYDADYSNLGYRERYSKNNRQKGMYREFRKNVEQLESEYEDLRICHEAWSSYNPLIPYLKLVTGCFCVLFSVCWILQICLYIFPQYWPGGFSYVPTYFLNDFITWGLIYSGFSLLGVIFIAVFGMYLFVCNVNGSFKIGLRFLVMDIHPMKIGGTYMSSFLINMILLLLQTPALINFIALAFSNSFVLTDIDTIMNNMVRYTTFFVYFFDNNVFVWMLLAFIILAMCLVYALPDEGKKSAKRLRKKIEKMQSTIEAKEKEMNHASTRLKGLGLKDITAKAKEAAEMKEDGGDMQVA